MAKRLTVKSQNRPTVQLSERRGDGYVTEFNGPTEVIDNTFYVQVKILSSRSISGVYTYEDPTGEFVAEDLVIVPFGPSDQEMVGRVVSRGRGSWTGPVKPILSELIEVRI